MLRKLGQSYQVAIPKDIVMRLGLHINDYLDIRLAGRSVVLEPQILVPKDQAYFYSKEWQKDEKKAAEDIRKGRVTKTKSVKEVIKKLKK